jgi:ketosteroid isomerase-like protein
MTETVEQRLRRLEDIIEIHQLFIDYGRALDDGDLDRYVSLFSINGVLDLGPIGSAQGRDNIRQIMAQALEGLVGASYHLITSPQISITGDRADATVMWTVIHRDDHGQPLVTMIGKHHDQLIRENDQWRIASRRGTIDIPSRYRTPSSPDS